MSVDLERRMNSVGPSRLSIVDTDRSVSAYMSLTSESALKIRFFSQRLSLFLSKSRGSLTPVPKLWSTCVYCLLNKQQRQKCPSCLPDQAPVCLRSSTSKDTEIEGPGRMLLCCKGMAVNDPFSPPRKGNQVGQICKRSHTRPHTHL